MNRLERLEKLVATPPGSGEGVIYEMEARVWECGRCGFTMLADHTDDGTTGHSCPACFEHALAPVLPDLLKLARKAEMVAWYYAIGLAALLREEGSDA